MLGIPKTLEPHINSAFPNDVCLIGTVLPNGYAQITPRGSTQVFDNEHFSLWERGRGSTTENLTEWHAENHLLPQATASNRQHFAQRRHRPLLRHRSPV